MSGEERGEARAEKAEEKPAKRRRKTAKRRKKAAEKPVEEAAVAEEAVAEEVQEEKVEERPLVKAGDLVLVDYTVKVKETGELVETTLESVAKEEGVEAAGPFEPRLVIPGKGFLLKAIEDELIGMEPGQEKSFELPPEKAFGPRDPSKVKVIPLRRLKDVEGPITVGSRITVDGKEGIVRSIGSGRVLIDFNPYLAGKTLQCQVKVVKILAEDMEKVKALIHHRIPDTDVDKFEVVIERPEIRIGVPQDAYLLPALQVTKRALARDLMEHIDGVERVVYLETYTRASF